MSWQVVVRWQLLACTLARSDGFLVSVVVICLLSPCTGCCPLTLQPVLTYPTCWSGSPVGSAGTPGR